MLRVATPAAHAVRSRGGPAAKGLGGRGSVGDWGEGAGGRRRARGEGCVRCPPSLGGSAARAEEGREEGAPPLCTTAAARPQAVVQSAPRPVKAPQTRARRALLSACGVRSAWSQPSLSASAYHPRRRGSASCAAVRARLRARLRAAVRARARARATATATATARARARATVENLEEVARAHAALAGLEGARHLAQVGQQCLLCLDPAHAQPQQPGPA